MSDEKTVIGDKMLETRLIENSNKLNISVDELIVRYLKRGLFTDDYYEPPERTLEELIEMSKKEAEKDRARGIPYKKHHTSRLIGINNKYD